SFAPRLAEAAWLVRRMRPGAMMDLSDGLAKDLPRLAAASGCGFRLDPAVLPRNRGCTATQALGDGEDYELLLAVPPQRWRKAAAGWRRTFPKLPLTMVGELTEAEGQPLRGGWEHFR